MKERFKKFRSEHEEAIFFVSSIVIGVSTGVLTAVVMNQKVDVLRVTQNQSDPNNFGVLLTNGRASYWSIQPTV